MKIITSSDLDRLINSLSEVFGESLRDTIATMFDQYSTDAVVAVKADDVVAQAIAWANSHNEFYYEAIDIDVDFKRYNFVEEYLLKEIDTAAIIDQIDWDANASTTANAIDEAIFAVYKESTILDFVSDAAAQYEENNNA